MVFAAVFEQVDGALSEGKETATGMPPPPSPPIMECVVGVVASVLGCALPARPYPQQSASSTLCRRRGARFAQQPTECLQVIGSDHCCWLKDRRALGTSGGGSSCCPPPPVLPLSRCAGCMSHGQLEPSISTQPQYHTHRLMVRGKPQCLSAGVHALHARCGRSYYQHGRPGCCTMGTWRPALLSYPTPQHCLNGVEGVGGVHSFRQLLVLRAALRTGTVTRPALQGKTIGRMVKLTPYAMC